LRAEASRSTHSIPRWKWTCSKGTFVDAGNNFSDDSSCGPGVAGITPGLDYETNLADNGGPTLTHALLPGSVAVDAAGDCDLDMDQRGLPRNDGACDSGSFELQVPPVLPMSSPVPLFALAAALLTGLFWIAARRRRVD